MQLGTNIRNWGPTATPDILRACAEHADRSTLHSIWLNDHIGLPPGLQDNPYGISPDMAHILDPLGVACYFAAVTQRIHIGTGVLILPYRPALPTVKWVATLQALSRDRLLLGVGVGYLDEEFRALGVPRTQRGRLTDDVLEVLRESARDEVVTRHGQPLRLAPRLSCPPIYVGGAPDTAIPRVLRHGDGWIPVGMPPDALAPHIADLNARAVAAGRPAPAIVQMKTLPLADPPAAIALAQAYRDIGVTHLVHTQGVRGVSEFEDMVGTLCERIAPAVREPGER